MLSRFEHFTALISEINRSVQKIEKDEMEKYGYRGAFAHYLLILAKSPEGLSVSQLCERSDRDKAAVSRILNEMAEKGLVLRPSDAKVYRGRFVLTEAGQAAAEFVSRRARSAVAAVGKSMDKAQREALYHGLKLIACELEILAREGIPSEGEANGQNNS